MSGPTDPLLAAFARLRPDVDVVEVQHPEPPAATQHEAQASMQHALATLAAVLEASAIASGASEAWWRTPQADIYQPLVEETVAFEDEASAAEAIVRVRDALVAAGWDTTADGDAAPQVRAVSEDGGIRVEARLDGPTLKLQSRGPELRLERDPR